MTDLTPNQFQRVILHGLYCGGKLVVWWDRDKAKGPVRWEGLTIFSAGIRPYALVPQRAKLAEMKVLGWLKGPKSQMLGEVCEWTLTDEGAEAIGIPVRESRKLQVAP